ncbi:hypothetical protein CHS0354_023355 [Potamilus streckersoni]|uniref:Major facilitator superfamily (MFS) profile domain-containing protein n=1 Tax=Potamilus streckersoni TaxID=2493646 RepID=A0AAE0T4S3_9BIVA|nr:hypothetical protein CHS0354_023355 [Potamilus streckersoni]
MGGGRHNPPNMKRRSNDKGSGDAQKTDPNLPVPPDGGWGWMVVLASFIIHIIADGIVYSFGIFYIEFLHYFKGSKAETAWVGSLVPGITLTVGPLASIMTNKYGCRVTTIVGAIIATAGFILSIFATNLYFLYFTFGVLSGIGFGLIYLPAIVSIAYYFEEKRSFATGLAVCGSGLGAFIFNPFTKFLIDSYDWRGATLILGGIILNCVLCGAMFRPLQPSKKLSTANYERESKNEHEKEALVKNEANGEKIPTAKMLSQSDSKAQPDFKSSSLQETSENLHSLAMSDGALNKKGDKYAQHPHQAKKRLLSENYDSSKVPQAGVYQSASLINVSFPNSNPALYLASIASIPNQLKEETVEICGCITVSEPLYRTLKNTFDFSLLKDVIFLMFVISNFFTSLGFNMPFIYLPDRAVDEGISEDDAKWLVSAVGISNTVGRVLFGYISDKPIVNKLMLYNSALLICGVATALSPLCFNYELLLLYSCVFGLFIGVYVSLTSVVLVDILGLEMLNNSFGLLLMFQGIATLIGPPIAGWLYDTTGRYDLSFLAAGIVVAVSGIMLYFIPMVKKCIVKKRSPDVLEMDTVVTN